jgi:hypothetical protein
MVFTFGVFAIVANGRTHSVDIKIAGKTDRQPAFSAKAQDYTPL